MQYTLVKAPLRMVIEEQNNIVSTVPVQLTVYMSRYGICVRTPDAKDLRSAVHRDEEDQNDTEDSNKGGTHQIVPLVFVKITTPSVHTATDATGYTSATRSASLRNCVRMWLFPTSVNNHGYPTDQVHPLVQYT